MDLPRMLKYSALWQDGRGSTPQYQQEKRRYTTQTQQASLGHLEPQSEQVQIVSCLLVLGTT
jgi:hypothetical protein